MANLDKFDKLVGDTIAECQRIEHDIKLIYAGMLKGNFESNLKTVENKALGPVLKLLENLDNSDGKPYFSTSDYQLLNEIKGIRNWLVHKSYTEFMYESGQYWDKLNRCYYKLIDFNNRLKQLSNNVEQIRLDLMKRYGRI